MKWPYHLIILIFLSALAAGAAHLWQTSIGWAAVAIGYGLALALRTRHLQRMMVWIEKPDEPIPASLGPYEAISTEIYKQRKIQNDVIGDLTETNDAIMAAAQALPIGIVTTDQNFLITWANHAAEQQLHLLLPNDKGQNLLNLLRSPEFASYATRREWDEPTIVKISRSGQSHSIMLRMVKYLRNQHLLITRDLTQIEKLETTRRDFVANVSHELRTPLTVLTGFVETLKDAPADVLSDEQRGQYLNMMHQQAQRMEALVSDLLTLSNIETSPSADFTLVDMDVLIAQERQQIETISGTKHRFDWQISPQLNLYGVAAELASALLNLMSNAVRYTPEGGLITVKWALELDGRAKFSVTDTGIGISSEHIPRLSERFYRVDRGRSRAAGGTGLGLAITKHIALRHETELDIQSKLGQGSTFSLIFPQQRVIASH